jgi:hypothetical protein
MKNRMRELRTCGSVRGEGREALAYSELTWTPLYAKRYFRFWITGRECSLTFGLCVRDELAGPDGICWSTP